MAMGEESFNSSGKFQIFPFLFLKQFFVNMRCFSGLLVLSFSFFCLLSPFSILRLTPSVGNITDHFNRAFHKAILLRAFRLCILSISDSLSHVPLSNKVIICHYVGKSFLAINVGAATAINWRDQGPFKRIQHTRQHPNPVKPMT